MGGKGKHSVFRTWVVSYLVVLLLPLIFSSIVYSFVYGIIRNNTATINEVSLKQTEESLNRIFSELRSTGSQLLTDQKVVSLSYAAEPLSAIKLQNIGQLQYELNRRSAYGSYISEIYVYFHNSRVAASTSGIIRDGAFQKTLKEKFYLDMEEFEKLGAPGGNQAKVKLIRDPSQPPGSVRKLAVFVSDAVQKKQPQVTCMFIIDASHLDDILESYDSEGAEAPRFVWAVSPEGNFLAPGPVSVMPDEVKEYLVQPDGTYFVTIGGEKSALMAQTSDFTGWKLIAMVSLEQYRAQLSSIRNTYLLFLILCLAVGGGVSLYFTKRNYSPIRRMTEMFLSELKGKKRQGGEDEFTLLESGLSEILQENRNYEQQIGHQKKDLRSLWLTKMMRGRIYSENTFRTVCEDYDIHFSGDSFLLIGITMQDCDSLLSREETTEEEAFAMVNFIVTSVMEELLRPRFDAYVCMHGNALNYDYGDALCGIVNFRRYAPGYGDREVTEQIKEQCRLAEKFVQEHLHIAMRCYISGIYSGWEGIHSAYEEMIRGMEQMESFQIEADIATGEDIQYQMQQGAKAGGEEISLQELCGAVSSGMMEEAWQRYIRILREDLADLDQSFFYVRLYSFSILEKVSQSLLKEERGNGDIAKELKKVRNIEELKLLVLSFFEEIHRQMVDSRAGDDMPLQIAGVVEYIDTHFSDPNLTVSSLAERFSISQSYLLRIFKKSINTGVLEYISQRRVDEAKRLLKSGGGTVGDVAQTVGYANSLALIRAFKKLEGITPATYRKIV